MRDVSDEKSATHVRHSPKRSLEETENILSLQPEPALLSRLVWSRWPLVKNQLSNIDCDSPKRHRYSSLAGDIDGGNARAGGFIARQNRIMASKSRK